MYDINIKEFEGKKFSKVVQESKYGGDELVFYIDDKRTYQMYHSQDCCEDVYLEDIDGPLDILVDAEIYSAECVTSDVDRDESRNDLEMWTFYKFRTSKGYLTMRWYGGSNGYYSVDVSIISLL